MGSVYLLIGWHNYYPAPDNTLAVFEREATANQILDEIEEASHWDAPDGDWERVVERYPWLPELKFDVYDVVEHSVIGR